MVDAKHLQQIDETLFESGDWLRAASPGPAVRELRVRHGALVRVVGTWKTAPPHPDQLAAMLECVSDLCGAIVRACNPSPGDASALMRRTGRPSHPSLRPSARPSARPVARTSIRPDARRTAPPGRHWPAAVLAIRPPPLPNVFQRTTRPPPRPASDPPER